MRLAALLLACSMLAGCAGGATFGLFDPVTAYDASGHPIIAYLPNDEAAQMVQSLAQKGGSLIGRYFAGDTGAQIGGAAALTLTAWITGRGRSAKMREQLARAEEEKKRKELDANYFEGLAHARGSSVPVQPGSEGADA